MREVRFGFRPDGWWEGHQVLPPDEGAIAQKALESARDEVFHERQPDADPTVRGDITWADAYVRVSEHALDGLDPTTRRGQARGERAQIILHVDARSDGDGMAHIHLGPTLPGPLRRYLSCDAEVRAVIEGIDGAFMIDGNPEQPDGLRFTDHWGRDIGPPHYGPLAPPLHGAEPHFTPPTGEPLNARWFGWN